MKSLKNYILESLICEDKSPRGTRGYVALVKYENGEEHVRTFPYKPTPEEAVEAELVKSTIKKFEVLEGPKVLTLKGYNWYNKEVLHTHMYYGDNGWLAGNYNLKEWEGREAWEVLADPKNKYTK